jgi:lipopolysaccharide export system permease protein
MKTLALYLIRQYLLRCALVLIGTATFALAADLMESGKNVVAMHEDSWRALLDYSLLRLPTYISTLLPVSSLIAGLWTVGVMYRQKELVAILNTGLSPFGLIRLVLLGSLPLVALQFLLDDRIVPRSIQELQSWDWAESAPDYFSPKTDGWLWLYSGHDIIRMENPRPRSRTFSDVTIFRRDAEGLILERIDAPVARITETGLMLEDAVLQSAADASTRLLPSYRWLGRIDFDIVQMLSWAPADLSLSQLNQVIDNAGTEPGDRQCRLRTTSGQHLPHLVQRAACRGLATPSHAAARHVFDPLLFAHRILRLDLSHGNHLRIRDFRADRHHYGHGRGRAAAALAGCLGAGLRASGVDSPLPLAARGPRHQSRQNARPGVTGGQRIDLAQRATTAGPRGAAA